MIAEKNNFTGKMKSTLNFHPEPFIQTKDENLIKDSM